MRLPAASNASRAVSGGLRYLGNWGWEVYLTFFEEETDLVAAAEEIVVAYVIALFSC